jgi:transcriptional regulator with XRE-family HTH domain
LRLKQLIEQHKTYSGASVEKIAEYLGLGVATTKKYLRNEARKYDATVIEKACDWLNVDVGQLLELVPCDFFPRGDKPLLRLSTKQDVPDDYMVLGFLMGTKNRFFFDSRNEFVCR